MQLYKTYFLTYSISRLKCFSHVYILITFIPKMISFIRRILSSVSFVVFKWISDIFFPIQPRNKTIYNFGMLNAYKSINSFHIFKMTYC